MSLKQRLPHELILHAPSPYYAVSYVNESAYRNDEPYALYRAIKVAYPFQQYNTAELCELLKPRRPSLPLVRQDHFVHTRPGWVVVAVSATHDGLEQIHRRLEMLVTVHGANVHLNPLKYRHSQVALEVGRRQRALTGIEDVQDLNQ
ncbi:hypothetical protein [Enteractinococcus helveticum]|uniref:Uncharacterized protein n=1 Tax=Enteractinococcus helveticum TaxID=1837282 RepID=A0A1B7M2J1_9MICC|nr:hypothetical protein [Enteractinococcus helveticum]OAV62816.1 hypothetical protein A6F49_04735 [Enteractinococcus helveticum]